MNLFPSGREDPQKEKLRNETDRVPWISTWTDPGKIFSKRRWCKLLKRVTRRSFLGFIHLTVFGTVFIVMVPGKDEIRKCSHASMLDHGFITFNTSSVRWKFGFESKYSRLARENLPHGHKFRWTLQTTDRHISKTSTWTEFIFTNGQDYVLCTSTMIYE